MREGDQNMNVRTLILTAGALVALAAPSVAGARSLPAKQKTKVPEVVKKSLTSPQSQPIQRYIYVSLPAVLPTTTDATQTDTSTSSDDDC
jgi:hypothetical protein